MDELVGSLRRAAGAHSSRLFETLFPGLDAGQRAEEIADFVGACLAPVGGVVFVRPGVGLVIGLQQLGGREVVLELHRKVL